MAANAGANNPHLVGRGQATVEIEVDRFGQWPLALDSERISHDGHQKEVLLQDSALGELRLESFTALLS